MLIYTGLPEKRRDDESDIDYPKTLYTCQESVIKWLTHFTQATKRHGKAVQQRSEANHSGIHTP